LRIDSARKTFVVGFETLEGTCNMASSRTVRISATSSGLKLKPSIEISKSDIRHLFPFNEWVTEAT